MPSGLLCMHQQYAVDTSSHLISLIRSVLPLEIQVDPGCGTFAASFSLTQSNTYGTLFDDI